MMKKKSYHCKLLIQSLFKCFIFFLNRRYENVRKAHPILDAITLDNIIQALSLTKNWETCINLMNEIKITSTPSSTCYSVLIAAAFSNDSDEIAWKLLNELIGLYIISLLVKTKLKKYNRQDVCTIQFLLLTSSIKS